MKTLHPVTCTACTATIVPVPNSGATVVGKLPFFDEAYPEACVVGGDFHFFAFAAFAPLVSFHDLYLITREGDYRFCGAS
jgi:hypothetical protein